MSRCIIHIGMHKTGSTSIQRSLKNHSDDKFLYGRFGELGNHSLSIYSIFSSHPERHHLHRSKTRDWVSQYRTAALKKLDRSIAAAHHRTLVISGEDIGVLAERDLENVRTYFDSRFDELTIVGYVRPPAGFISSSFQQRVQSGAMNVFDPPHLYQSYRQRFAKFDRVFGQNRVQLWKFDPKAFPESDVVRDFCARLGLSRTRQKSAHTNESMPAQAIAALYVYNKFGKFAGTNILAGADGMALAKVFKGEKFRLSPDVIRPVLDKNRPDIDWMEQRLGQSLDEELDEHRSTDVRTEQDLLRPDPDLAGALLKRLGRFAPAGVNGRTPEEIALLIHAARIQRRYFDVDWWLSRMLGEKPLKEPAPRNLAAGLGRHPR